MQINVTMSSKTNHLVAFFKIEFFCLGKSPLFSLLKDSFTSAIRLSITVIHTFEAIESYKLLYSTQRCLLPIVVTHQRIELL